MSTPVAVDQTRPAGTARHAYWMETAVCLSLLGGIGYAVQCITLAAAFGQGSWRGVTWTTAFAILVPSAVVAFVIGWSTERPFATPRQFRTRIIAFARQMGLAPFTRRVRVWTLCAVPISIAALVAVTVIINVVDFTEPAADDRVSMLHGASPLQLVAFGVLVAPLIEETLYRAPLLAIAVHWPPHQHRRVRAFVLLAASTVSGIGFAYGHAEYGCANVLSALIAAAVHTALTLVSRSLIPAITAHAVNNTIAAVFAAA